ncbi:MAG: M56 family metallopeptidase [Clostridia bacterium]|nr:M56 family metallopeptidase [Clostridia bacterium]
MSSTAITFLFTLLGLELLFTAGSACVLLLRRSEAPPAGRRMRLIWLAVWLCSLIPLRIFAPAAAVTIYEEPVTQAVRIEFSGYEAGAEISGEAGVTAPTDVSVFSPATEREPLIIRLRASSADWIQRILILLCSVWITGTAASLIGRISERRGSALLLRQHSAPCADGRLLTLYRESAAGLGMRYTPPLRIFEEGMVLSPCCTGIFRPTVCVSDAQRTMSDEALTLIFTHELSHVRSRDMLLSLLCDFVCAFHWINPLCEQVERAVTEDCELGCDEVVLRTCGENSRVPYIHAILDVASGVTAYAAGMGSFYAASDRAEFIKRRYDRMKNRRSGRLTTFLAILMTAVLLGSNMLALSSCVTTASEAKPVTLQNPVLANAVAEYFGVAVEELTEDHMNRITSLEILPTGWEYETREELGIIPVRIRINGGVLPTASGDVEIGMPYDIYKDGYVFESLPLMMDQKLLDPLLDAVRAQDDWNANKLTAFYCLKDATEATLEGYAYDLLVRQFCDASAADRYVDENGGLLDINGDGSIDDQDVALIGSVRSYQEGEAIVAALPEETRNAFMQNFKKQAKEEILALHPYAAERPMYLLDPECKPREITHLLLILQQYGILEGRALTETTVDLADTAMMSQLEMLYVSEAFTAVNVPEK